MLNVTQRFCCCRIKAREAKLTADANLKKVELSLKMKYAEKEQEVKMLKVRIANLKLLREREAEAKHRMEIKCIKAFSSLHSAKNLAEKKDLEYVSHCL